MFERISTVKLEQLDTLLIQAHRMLESPRVQGSLRHQIEKELSADRSPTQQFLREIRRIGVGYRDKGALRPSHSPREDQMVTPDLWVEDVEYLLRLDHPPLEDWITAQEVLDPVLNQPHVVESLIQLQRMIGQETVTQLP